MCVCVCVYVAYILPPLIGLFDVLFVLMKSPCVKKRIKKINQNTKRHEKSQRVRKKNELKGGIGKAKIKSSYKIRK